MQGDYEVIDIFRLEGDLAEDDAGSSEAGTRYDYERR